MLQLTGLLILYPIVAPVKQKNKKEDPTEQQAMKFSFTEKHALKINGKVEKVFSPEFTPIQKQALKLLGVPMSAFQI